MRFFTHQMKWLGMLTFFLGSSTGFAQALSSTAPNSSEPVFLMVIDPNDKEWMQALTSPLGETNSLPPKVSAQPPSTGGTTNSPSLSPLPAAPKPPESLDDLITGLKERRQLSKLQTKVLQKIEKDERDFLKILDTFNGLTVESKEGELTPAFVKARERLVKLVFDSPNEKTFYSRLYLINKSWLDHRREIVRFKALHEALQSRALEIEERNRRFQELLTRGASTTGLFIGGYLLFKVSTSRVWPILPDEKGFQALTRWAMRGSAVLVGAYVGSLAGRYAGILGSAYLFANKEFIDPIDGDNDLQEMLDLVQTL